MFYWEVFNWEYLIHPQFITLPIKKKKLKKNTFILTQDVLSWSYNIDASNKMLIPLKSYGV